VADLLSGGSPFSQNQFQDNLQKFDGQFVTLNDGTVLETNTLVWAAGVKGNLIEGLPDSSVVNSRIKVDLYNRVHGFDDIYAVGDIAHMEEGEYKNGHPMLAPVAMQQGRLLAQNLVNMSKNKPLKPFHYENRGAMATIGRNKAVVDLPGNITFGGLFAWMFWMFIHIVSIIGFRNKLVIFSNWVWNYFTYDRGTRLIIRLFLPNGKEREKFGTY
jgi:NADH dehydrogenase